MPVVPAPRAFVESLGTASRFLDYETTMAARYLLVNGMSYEAMNAKAAIAACRTLS